ncbi:MULTISPECIES: hypothetical protein [unclassified Paenibacillus]|uniref:ATP-dependent DNA ligase n=1 Tax=unclassified Paenibacillus TaxID=185978 RepID=UPI001AE13EF6|nr:MULTISPECIES: hypothetical protein [unclassified Paenibacillus]MBP1156185.1 ATP-dependent DNA ligase [Paenibacillus sp. PvP091]MBP1168429.1 ATP-dependent DNA ligase [Paenibacillus sp. PvR098]MBP2439457.1 ATP-dependent DNA ligase [Paenibacillus sp. PvP052]
MDRLQLTERVKIHSFAKHRSVHYVVWDILHHKGRDLRELSLMKRRSILESIMKTNASYHIIPQMDERGEDLYKQLVDQSMQGMVAKKKDSPYVSRRSHDWLKIVNYRYEDVFITGYRKVGSGWLAHVQFVQWTRHGFLRKPSLVEFKF